MKDLVLVGGGHSHVEVLRQFGLRPLPDTRITLISRDTQTPYSGMLPGLIAGHYTSDEAHIDLVTLARYANAQAIVDEVVGIDLAARQVLCRRHPPLSYDVLSINTGSTPSLAADGAAAHAVPVKPIDRFLGHWCAMTERLRRGASHRRVAVVGGGAGGVELILAVEYRMRTLIAGAAAAPRIEYHLFTAGPDVLPAYNPRVRRWFDRVLAERGIKVHTGRKVVAVSSSQLQTEDGEFHLADEILWTTEAAAPSWPAASGLAVDEGGFIRVSRSLQSTSHGDVFAAGDVAAMFEDPRPKSGVVAVRQGPPLARNLRQALLGQQLEAFHPQHRFLSLISTGDKYAIASRGSFACRGAWVWQWKDWIDRRFIRTYHQPSQSTGAAGRRARK